MKPTAADRMLKKDAMYRGTRHDWNESKMKEVIKKRIINETNEEG